MKQLYIVTPEDYTWDQYDSIMVLAESEEEAIKMGEDFFDGEEDLNPQGKVSAKLVDMTEAGIVHTSFNAG